MLCAINMRANFYPSLNPSGNSALSTARDDLSPLLDDDETWQAPADYGLSTIPFTIPVNKKLDQKIIKFLQDYRAHDYKK